MQRIIVAALVLLAACSGGNGGSSPTADRSNALDAAAASADETQQAVDALAGTSNALAPQGLRAGLLSLAIPVRPGCATVSSDADADGDGIPDSAVYTFALPACQLTAFRGGDLALTGDIRITDPDAAPGYAYRLEYQDFKWDMTQPDTTRSFATTRNGTRQLALENGALVLESAVTMVRGFGKRGDGSIGSEIRSVFTPATPLTFGMVMPDGTVEQTGTVTMSRNGIPEPYDVVTAVPLQIDGTCAAYPRISAGEVHYVLADGAYVRVRWPGCGQEAVVDVVEP